METICDDFPYKPSGNYGMFGYKGASLDRAIRQDDVAAIEKAHKLEWIDPETRTFLNDTLRTLARKQGSAKVDAALGAMGYPA